MSGCGSTARSPLDSDVSGLQQVTAVLPSATPSACSACLQELPSIQNLASMSKATSKGSSVLCIDTLPPIHHKNTQAALS